MGDRLSSSPVGTWHSTVSRRGGLPRKTSAKRRTSFGMYTRSAQRLANETQSSPVGRTGVTSGTSGSFPVIRSSEEEIMLSKACGDILGTGRAAISSSSSRECPWEASRNSAGEAIARTILPKLDKRNDKKNKGGIAPFAAWGTAFVVRLTVTSVVLVNERTSSHAILSLICRRRISACMSRP